MISELHLLKLNPENASTKQKIISVLSNEWPLTAKQIHNRLRKYHSSVNTYQATHKTIKQMEKDQILIKIAREYSLNSEWLLTSKKEIETISSNIENKNRNIQIANLADNESVTFSFRGIRETGRFLIEQFMTAPNPHKKTNIALWRFCYSILGLDPANLIKLKETLTNDKWAIFVEGDKPVDKMFGETLQSYGAKKIKYGIKCATKLSDKMIAGDFLAEIIYPSDFRKIWEIQNQLPRKIMEFNLAKHLILMIELSPKIDIIVTKNRTLTDEYRKEYTYDFEKKGKKI